MDVKEIQDLIRFVAEAGVSEVELEQDGFKLTIKKNAAPAPHVHYTATLPDGKPQEQTQQPQPQQQSAVATPQAPPAAKGEPIKSPMIGTFYRRASPDKEPFVKPGDMVQKGQVVCIIEAMKLFNEIEAEVSGRITKVMVEDQSPVEYDQPLFLVEAA